MTYESSWEPRYRVVTAEPSKFDLFVVIFVNGVRAPVHPITRYGELLAEAREAVEKHKLNIKVLPMTGDEVKNLLGLKFDPPSRPSPSDAAERQEMVRNLFQIARETTDDDARHDAFDVLTSMGAIQS